MTLAPPTTVRLERATRAAIERQAIRKGITRSELTRRLLRAALAARNQRRPAR